MYTSDFSDIFEELMVNDKEEFRCFDVSRGINDKEELRINTATYKWLQLDSNPQPLSS